jgi:hypothetical protein
VLFRGACIRFDFVLVLLKNVWETFMSGVNLLVDDNWKSTFQLLLTANRGDYNVPETYV